jgi:hypothetical protein
MLAHLSTFYWNSNDWQMVAQLSAFIGTVTPEIWWHGSLPSIAQ